MSGQVNRGSKFGEYLFNLCTQDDINIVVELGTWNGEGTTKCVMDALINKFIEEVKLYSLESNLQMHKTASQYWEKALFQYNSAIKERLQLIHGRIVEKEDLMELEYLKKQPDYDSRWEFWLSQDLQNLDSCPNIIDKIPEKIDLLILDGGEFSTLAEFKILMKRSNYIACDDTRVLKCREIRDILLKDNNFICLIDELNNRNGFCIFKNKMQ